MKIYGKFVKNFRKYNMKTYVLNLLAGLLLFFAPIQGLLLTVGVAILLDTLTGIYKSVKIKGWRSIKSRKLSDIIGKMFLYEMCVVALYPIDYYLLNELTLHIVSIEFFATKLTCVLLIFIELVSIKENIEKARNIDIWAMLKNILKRTKEIKDDVDDITG